jgi:hypothetical protein
VALLIAIDGDDLVGYLGMLPDTFSGPSGRHRGAWLSTLWIDPNQRGQGIAKRLLQEAFNCWHDRIAVTRFTTEAAALYERSGKFSWLLPLAGVRCYMRSNLHDLLPKRFPKLGMLKWPLVVIDTAMNVLHDLRIRLWLSSHRLGFRTEHVPTVDDEMAALIPLQEGNPFRRSQVEMNWILAYPWLLEGKTDKRYHFSSADRQFKMECIKVYGRDEQLLGWAMLNTRNGNIQVPYFFASANGYDDVVISIIRETARRKANTITVINEDLARTLRQNGPFWLRRRFCRRYILSTKLWAELGAPGITPQDGDADAAWT